MTRPRVVVACLLGLALLAAPEACSKLGTPYALFFLAHALVFALAACSLDIILGFGGMASFGHALFLGIGAYSVGMLSFSGIGDGWLHLLTAVAASGLVALLTGLVAIRAQGVAFIMITLAFAQTFYFAIFSLKQYGGGDGLTIRHISRFGPFDFANLPVLYYALLATLIATIVLTGRMMPSRFGMVLRGCRLNEPRMRALGFPTRRYRLAAYVVSGMLCSVAGVFLGDLTAFASPAYVNWTVSGELLIMVVLGGSATLVGPAVGAMLLLVLEEMLKRVTDHWSGALGVAIVAIAMLSRHGVWGAFGMRP